MNLLLRFAAMTAFTFPVAFNIAQSATITFTNAADNDITNSANWSGGSPTFGSTVADRWNINGTTTYTAAQGTTGLSSSRQLGVGTSGNDGSFTITGGILNLVGSSQPFAADANSGNSTASITVSGGELNSNNTIYLGPRTNNGGTATYDVSLTASGGDVIITGNLLTGAGLNNERTVPAGSTATVEVSAGSLAISGDIRSGSWSTDANTLNITVSGGAMSVSEITQLSSGTMSIDLQGGSLTANTIEQGGSTSPGDVNLTIDGGTLIAGTSNASLIASNVTSVAIGDGGAIFDSDGNTAVSIRSGMTGGAGTVTYNGGLSGTFRLFDTKTYDGETIVNSRVRLSNNSALGSTNGATTVNSGGQLFANFTREIDEAITFDTASAIDLAWNMGGNSVWTQNGSVTLDSEVLVTVDGGAAIDLDGSLSGAGAMNVGGSGWFNINSSNPGYTQTISVRGNLGGNGTVGSAVALNGGQIGPGQSIGAMSITSLEADDLNGGALLIEYDESQTDGNGAIDVLTVTGELNLTNLTIDFNNIDPGPASLTGASHIFATYGSLIGSTFASALDIPAGYEIDYAFGGNNIALVQQIPEPRSLVLAAMLVCAGTVLLRRRRLG